MSLFDDVRYSARVLVRAPLFSLIVVVTLALGIGANAAVFTVVDSVLIKKLPFGDPDRLVAIRFPSPNLPGGDASVPSPAIGVWAAQSRTLDSVATYTIGDTSLTLPTGDQVKVTSASISPGLFATLGSPAMQMGRSFGPEDAGWGRRPNVAIVSRRFWRDSMGAPSKLDEVPLRLFGIQTFVVGVLPESFRFPDVVTPDILTPQALPPPEFVVMSVRAVARLRPGTTISTAESELRQITDASEPSFPTAMVARMKRGGRPSVLSLQEHLAGNVRPVLLIAFGVAGVVLLIACANVAGLLLARITGRQREMAIRVALGGTPAHLARLLLAESLLLALAGGTAAMLTVQWSLAVLRQYLLGTAPHSETLAMDTRVATFTLAASLLAALLCAIIPAARLLRRRRRWDWKMGGFGVRHLARRALVVGQVAGAVILLVGALLLLTTLSRLSNTDVGFHPRNLLTMRMDASKWTGPRTDRLDEILERIRTLPGVTSVAAASAFPLDGHGFGFSITVDNQSAPAVEEDGIGVDLVTPDYFQTMGIALRSGRAFAASDTAASPRVAIVNEAFLRLKRLTSSSALDRRVGLGASPEYATIQIVGVVEDVKDRNPGDEAQPIVYLRFTQAAPNIGWAGANVVIRSTSDPLRLAEPVRQTIAASAPGAQALDVKTMEQRIAALLAPQRQRAVVFGIFGVTAVVLAAVGLYGLLAYIVSQEMREFGIRLAIGASRTQLATLVLGRGLVSAAMGLTLGLIGARLATHVLAGMLYGVTATDPTIYAIAGTIMLAVAALASYLPARRAMRADPLVALRSE